MGDFSSKGLLIGGVCMVRDSGTPQGLDILAQGWSLLATTLGRYPAPPQATLKGLYQS